MSESTAEKGSITNRETAVSYTWLVVLVTVLAVLSDQLTKLWALRVLPADGSVAGSFGPMRLRLLRNPGAAFSFGEGTTWVFTVIAVLVVAGVFYYVARNRVENVWFALLLGLIAGGGIGNLIDRLFQPPGFAVGHVVDFLDYGGVFVGNVADIWIVVGAIGMALFLFLRKEPPSSPPEQTQ